MSRTKRYQIAGGGPRDKDRSDHIWFPSGGRWKCLLCGAVTHSPPPYPTPPGWSAALYEPLSDDERRLSPYVPKAASA